VAVRSGKAAGQKECRDSLARRKDGAVARRVFARPEEMTELRTTTGQMQDLLPPAVPERLPYMPGIDGLRAIAVIAVIAYHAEFGFIPGGFLGVEVFLVISGYLITSLLVLERLRTSAVNLKEFWARRARRLLPALGVLLVLTVTGALLFARDALFRLNQDVLGALTYSTNWVMIFRQESYFEAFSRPPLLRHLWSLAVEEQFYLFFPLIFLGGMALLSRRSKGHGQTARRFFLVASIGALASAALMWALFVPYEDPSRVYFGTDTRAAGLLIGVALAFLWQPWRFAGKLGTRGTVLLNVAGFAALGGLTMLLLRMGEYDLFLYRGGFFTVSMLTAAVIAVTVHPQGALNPVLGNRPLVWVGKRSYGLYLYHWPVFIFLRPGIDVPWDRWPTLAVQVALTFAIAEVSYRWIEQPIRKRGFKDWLAWLTEPWRIRSPRAAALWPVIAGVFLLGLTIGLVEGSSTGPVAEEPLALAVGAQAVEAEVPSESSVNLEMSDAAITPDPEVSTTASEPAPPAAPVQQGAAASVPVEPATPDVARASGETGDHHETTEASVPITGATVTIVPDAVEAPTTEFPPPGPEPQAVAATPPVAMIGDSVMLGAKAAITERIDGAVVDARVSRQMKQVPEVVGELWRADALGAIAVVHLGTNGVFSSDHFDSAVRALEGADRIYFVNAKVSRRWEGAVNESLRAGVDRWPNARLIDWNSAASDHPEYFGEDGVHLTGDGIAEYAALIARSIDR
jgi:peptidoglycan/LPS O-acetylase OafA/YrhL